MIQYNIINDHNNKSISANLANTSITAAWQIINLTVQITYIFNSISIFVHSLCIIYIGNNYILCVLHDYNSCFIIIYLIHIPLEGWYIFLNWSHQIVSIGIFFMYNNNQSLAFSTIIILFILALHIIIFHIFLSLENQIYFQSWRKTTDLRLAVFIHSVLHFIGFFLLSCKKKLSI